MDLTKRDSKEILRETDFYIDSVTFEEDNIIFSYNGHSALSGFSVFPFKKIYSISKGTFTEEISYKELGYQANIGGYVNEVDFDSIVMDDKILKVQFKHNDNTILAGGETFPRIKTGLRNGNVFYLDLRNVTISDEKLLSLNHLKVHPLIEKIEAKKYTDALDIPYLVLLLTMNEVSEFYCNLPIIDGERQLHISFR